MAKVEIDIRDDIDPLVAIDCVRVVMTSGKVSIGENGKKYYCWATTFSTKCGTIIVSTRQYRKNDCFVVYKKKGCVESKQ